MTAYYRALGENTQNLEDHPPQPIINVGFVSSGPRGWRRCSGGENEEKREWERRNGQLAHAMKAEIKATKYRRPPGPIQALLLMPCTGCWWLLKGKGFRKKPFQVPEAAAPWP